MAITVSALSDAEWDALLGHKSTLDDRERWGKTRRYSDLIGNTLTGKSGKPKKAPRNSYDPDAVSMTPIKGWKASGTRTEYVLKCWAPLCKGLFAQEGQYVVYGHTYVSDMYKCDTCGLRVRELAVYSRLGRTVMTEATVRTQKAHKMKRSTLPRMVFDPHTQFQTPPTWTRTWLCDKSAVDAHGARWNTLPFEEQGIVRAEAA